MDQLEQAVFEIDKVIQLYMNKLEEKYQKINYYHKDKYIKLECHVDYNHHLILDVSHDSLGLPPKHYFGIERQKKGGYEQEVKDLQEYEKKKKRIEKTDGLKIQFKWYKQGENWEIAPNYDFDQELFIKEFKSFFFKY